MDETISDLKLCRAFPPTPRRFQGRFVALEPLARERHGAALFASLCGPANADLWAYMADGPYVDRDSFLDALDRKASSPDPLLYALVDQASEKAAGQAALMRIDAANGAIEIGSIMFGAPIARTAAATEAIYLLAKHVFDELGYRRLEWKCNERNAASKRAAERFGFTFEGVFRQHMIVKGRNRDTAWFSMLDGEWPQRRAAFEAWLAPENFDAEGRQKAPLGRFMPPSD